VRCVCVRRARGSRVALYRDPGRMVTSSAPRTHEPPPPLTPPNRRHGPPCISPLPPPCPSPAPLSTHRYICNHVNNDPLPRPQSLTGRAGGRCTCGEEGAGGKGKGKPAVQIGDLASVDVEECLNCKCATRNVGGRSPYTKSGLLIDPRLVRACACVCPCVMVGWGLWPIVCEDRPVRVRPCPPGSTVITRHHPEGLAVTTP
jgi:hypothetical protein